MSETIQQGIFLVLAALMLISSVGVITARNQVYSAMSLVASFFFLAAVYAMLGAHTIAILQVLVYAGAIVVLFLFVIMLLSVQESPPLPFLQTLSPMRVLVFAATLLLGVLLVAVSLNTAQPELQVKIVSVEAGMGGEHLVTFDSSPFGKMRYATGKLGGGRVLGTVNQAYTFDVTGVSEWDPPVQTVSLTGGRGEPKVGQIARVFAHADTLRPEFGTVSELGLLLYGRYLLPFEVTSLLLLVAIVGAVVVAKGKILMIPASWAAALAGLMLAIGILGVLTRRSALIVFMSVELMLNAANLTFLAFARERGDMAGHAAAFFVMAVAAAEAAVGLAIMIAVYRTRGTLNVDEIDLMKN